MTAIMASAPRTTAIGGQLCLLTAPGGPLWITIADSISLLPRLGRAGDDHANTMRTRPAQAWQQ
jgi:hypothetical protein